MLFTYPIPVALADYLLSALYPARLPQPGPPLPTAARSADELQRLGADDLLAMLDEELSLVRKNDKKA